jgi:hypothetical protein
MTPRFVQQFFSASPAMILRTLWTAVTGIKNVESSEFLTVWQDDIYHRARLGATLVLEFHEVKWCTRPPTVNWRVPISNVTNGQPLALNGFDSSDSSFHCYIMRMAPRIKRLPERMTQWCGAQHFYRGTFFQGLFFPRTEFFLNILNMYCTGTAIILYWSMRVESESYQEVAERSSSPMQQFWHPQGWMDWSCVVNPN